MRFIRNTKRDSQSNSNPWQTFPMRNLTATICQTLAMFLGSPGMSASAVTENNNVWMSLKSKKQRIVDKFASLAERVGNGKSDRTI